MPASQASRRLVKSPPELWAEVSDAASLARHLGEVGEIRITRLEPETTVAWEGERASGTVELAPAGWGTSVTLTAEPVADPADDAAADAAEPVADAAAEPVADAAAEPVADAAEPIAEPAATEPVVEEASAEPSAAAELAPAARPEPAAADPAPAAEAEPPRRSWFARLFKRAAPAPVEAVVVEPVSAPEPVVPADEPEPQPEAVVAPESTAPPEPEAPSEPVADPLEDVLTSALDSLGAAHHRPFSRG
jgi:hypothetical protein